MATVLQSARQLSDQDAALAVATDRAWHLVLGTLDADEDAPPFKQTAILDFRMRLIAHDMDRRLVEPVQPAPFAAPGASRTPST